MSQFRRSASNRRLDMLPMPGLDHHLDTQSLTHRPAMLSLHSADLYISVTGSGVRRDCYWREVYEGTNNSNDQLRRVYLTSDTDFVTDDSAATIRCYDRMADPLREHPVQLVETEGNDFGRWVSVPLSGEGSAPGEPFAIELAYSMSGIVDARIDYWYFDPFAKFASISQMNFFIRWYANDLRQALYVTADKDDKSRSIVERLPVSMASYGWQCHLRIGKPDPDKVHAVLLGSAYQW